MIKLLRIHYVLAVFMAIDLALIGFFAYPTLKEIKAISRDILSGKDSVVLFDVQSKEIEQFKRKYPEYKPNLENINNLFVDGRNPVVFIQFLEKLAGDSGVVSQINLSQYDPDAKPVAPMLFQINIKGSFSNIVEYFEKLENGPYLVRVNNFDIQKSPEDTVLPLSVRITVEAITK